MLADADFSGEAGGSNRGDLGETIREVIDKRSIVKRNPRLERIPYDIGQRDEWCELDFSPYQFDGIWWSLRIQFQGQDGMETKFL